MSFPFGKNIKLTIDGGAHDEKIVMRLSGVRAGIEVDSAELSAFLSRRAPSNTWETARKEEAPPHFTCGIANGATTGEEICAYIENYNVNSSAYADVNRFPRPSHADYPAVIKYGENVDLRGGGHFSGRLTALTCTAGFIAMQYIKRLGVEVFAHVYSVKDICDTPFSDVFPEKCSEGLPVINKEAEKKMTAAMLEAGKNGDSLGGVIECAVTGLEPGLGEHMFRSVEAAISDAVFSVPSVKGIEFGAGFNGTRLFGSEFNDAYFYDSGTVKTRTNNNGGILGGMTNGMPVIFRAAIKPVPSIAKTQQTVDLAEHKNAEITINGRHDSCIVFRAVPVIEAAAALAAADILLGEEKHGTDILSLRREIDKTDAEIVSLLCSRMEISKAVAEEKAKTGKSVYDPEREKQLLDRIKALAGENAPLAEEIYNVILKYSKNIQTESMKGKR